MTATPIPQRCGSTVEHEPHICDGFACGDWREVGDISQAAVVCDCGVSWVNFDAVKLHRHLTDHFAVVHEHRIRARAALTSPAPS